MSDQSDTQRTDAIVNGFKYENEFQRLQELLDFARQLERELVVSVALHQQTQRILNESIVTNRELRDKTIEECAKVAKFVCVKLGADYKSGEICDAIRALKGKAK
jgi:hypothetical protein